MASPPGAVRSEIDLEIAPVRCGEKELNDIAFPEALETLAFAGVRVRMARDCSLHVENKIRAKQAHSESDLSWHWLPLHCVSET